MKFRKILRKKSEEYGLPMSEVRDSHVKAPGTEGHSHSILEADHSPIHDEKNSADARLDYWSMNVHVDSLGRLKERGDKDDAQHIDPVNEQHINPRNRKLQKLEVRKGDRIWDEIQNAMRTCHDDSRVKNVSPWVLQVLAWGRHGCWDPILWLLKAFALTPLILLPIKTGKMVWGGNYAPLHYGFNGYPKSAANKHELPCRSGLATESPRDSSIASRNDEGSTLVERVLRPEKLTFVDPDPNNPGFETKETKQWLAENRSHKLRYLFIAWNGHQFPSDEDRDKLEDIACQATMDAGLPAFYLSRLCFNESNNNKFSKPTLTDVWQLCDVVRGAEQVAVIVGSSGQPRMPTKKLLQEFAARVWTFPEILLAPAKRDILVYNKDAIVPGSPFPPPERYPKNLIASELWEGELAIPVQNLINHFEGNLTLSRLELPITMLECLYNGSRHLEKHFDGDRAYALSGILNMRPMAVETDSAFQAFARLSLANDSDRLLERMVCMLPKSPNQPWHVLKDAWDSELWHIEPRCQISGVGHHDTIILDNARGAAIRWKGFAPVADTNSSSTSRFMALMTMRAGVFFFPIAVILLPMQQNNSDQQAEDIGSSTEDVGSSNEQFQNAGITLMVLAIALILSLPLLVGKVVGGKKYYSQAWLFGFEGYMEIGKIEKMIWARDQQRLSWSCFSSMASKHELDDKTRTVRGLDPLKEAEIQARARGEKIYTLVDTVSMTATLFTAKRPPVGLIVCGSEGGMQRAVGVSYDWTSKTLYKETVLRIPTPNVARMRPVPRFRFGFHRG